MSLLLHTCISLLPRICSLTLTRNSASKIVLFNYKSFKVLNSVDCVCVYLCECDKMQTLLLSRTPVIMSGVADSVKISTDSEVSTVFTQSIQKALSKNWHSMTNKGKFSLYYCL